MVIGSTQKFQIDRAEKSIKVNIIHLESLELYMWLTNCWVLLITHPLTHSNFSTLFLSHLHTHNFSHPFSHIESKGHTGSLFCHTTYQVDSNPTFNAKQRSHIVITRFLKQIPSSRHPCAPVTRTLLNLTPNTPDSPTITFQPPSKLFITRIWPYTIFVDRLIIHDLADFNP